MATAEEETVEVRAAVATAAAAMAVATAVAAMAAAVTAVVATAAAEMVEVAMVEEAEIFAQQRLSLVCVGHIPRCRCPYTYPTHLLLANNKGLVVRTTSSKWLGHQPRAG